jgi:hypothetical protein
VADGTVPVTGGTGHDIKVYVDGASAKIQYVRPHTVVTPTLDAWTVTTAGAASRVAADEARTGLAFANASTTAVFVRPDNTIPTVATGGWFAKIQPGDLYEVEPEWRELAWSVAGEGASSGTLNIWKGVV